MDVDVPVSEEQLVQWVHRIKGKTVVIPGLYGSSHGVGKELAVLCASKGANVVVGDRDVAALQSVIASIKTFGGRAEFKPTDIRRPEEVNDLFKFAVSTYGHVDVVVYVAGLGGETDIPFSEQEKDLYKDPLVIGVKNVITISKQYLEHNAQSDLKSLVLVTTPGINNVKTKVARTVKELVPEFQAKGIKIGSIFPWFGDIARIPPKLKVKMGPQVRPPLPRIATAALFIATDPEHNGCLLILTDNFAVDMIEYNAITKLMAKIQEKIKEVNAKLEQQGQIVPDGELPTFQQLIASGILPPGWEQYAQRAKEEMARASRVPASAQSMAIIRKYTAKL